MKKTERNKQNNLHWSELSDFNLKSSKHTFWQVF